MTLVACWLDHSFGQTRICALADARASEELSDKQIIVHSDLTQKLFLVDVHSYAVDGVVPGIGAALPYHQTKIGVGFSGHCFEALTAIAYLERSLGALIDVDGKQPRPEPLGIAELARRIVSLYLGDHKFGGEHDLDLLLFGFDDDRSWAATVHWDKATKQAHSKLVDLEQDLIVAIGDGTSSTSVVQDVSRLRQRIAGQVTRARLPGEAAELRRARLEILRSSAVVGGIKKVVDNEFVPTVGGALQKVELLRDGGIVLGTYVKDPAEHILNHLSSVSSSATLAPLPIEERLNDAHKQR